MYCRKKSPECFHTQCQKEHGRPILVTSFRLLMERTVTTFDYVESGVPSTFLKHLTQE